MPICKKLEENQLNGWLASVVIPLEELILSIQSSEETLVVEQEGSVVTITINAPPANIWNAERLLGLNNIVRQCEEDARVLSIIITGSGSKFFCAGADIKLFASGERDEAERMVKHFGHAFERLMHFEGLTIAAINGFAMGGGLECALACDIRIACNEAVMGLPEAKIGVLPGGCGTQTLPWLVGEPWAKRMILCGERVDAQKALQIGLVEEVVGQDELKDVAMNMAKSVEQQSPTAVRYCKQLIQKARTTPMPAALEEERSKFVNLFGHHNQVEGVAAFLEKRTPVWKDE